MVESIRGTPRLLPCHMSWSLSPCLRGLHPGKPTTAALDAWSVAGGQGPAARASHRSV